ncbi:MAG: divergent polysaccharide deacetylase family protein [Planctomycetes bacterium]|nr:divergent polysaccharide deacetylase family protein [Planctomycetota bacterium]
MKPLAAGLLALCVLAPLPSVAEPSATDVPRRALVSIVIDDIGYRREDGLRAIELPGDVTFAVLPHTPHGASIARLAWQLGKEVILHLPMESRDSRHLGPGGITTAMGRAEIQRTVVDALRAVPHAVGLSNHMGSLLTADRERMGWVMQTLGTDTGLLFLDSRTAEDSVAAEVAAENGVPTMSRDVFLDNVRDTRLIRRQFMALVRTARARGGAVAIGHPFPETVQVLREMLPQLSALGVELVPVSEMLRVMAPPPLRTPATLQAAADGERVAR